MSTPKVAAVKVLDPYVLHVTFQDGASRKVNMNGLLKGVFEDLRDPDFFRKVTIDPVWHTLVWPNGADLAPEFLYEGAEGADDSLGEV
jgi:hypothetical protein